jgi:S1-C subfamily serine protease
MAQWPDTLADYQKSLCLVEFYQPQYEVREIKDDARIKKQITGIIVNSDGLVMTSDIIFPAKLDIVSQTRFFHAGQSKPEDITVILENKKEFEAQLVGIDEDYRVAFIQIREPENLPEPIKFGKTSEAEIGDKIYLIQHLTQNYNSEVIISEHHINSVIEKPFQKILTTGSPAPLSAGGLAINSSGNPLGIIFRTNDFTPAYNYDIDFTIGRASITTLLPGHYLIKLIENPPKIQKQKNGTGKSWLGIRMQILKKEMAAYWEIPGTYGIIINSVVPQSPAEKSGMKVGDIITGINDLTIQGEEDQDLELIRKYIRSLPAGKAKVSLIRDQKKMKIDVQIENAPISKYFSEEYSEEFLRFSIKELTQDIIIENDLDFDIEGVWVSRVEEAGPASLSGLQIQDLIMTINDQKVTSLDDFKQLMQPIVQNKPEYVQLFVRRGNNTLFVFVKTLYEYNGATED